jgi:hypothetical protein
MTRRPFGATTFAASILLFASFGAPIASAQFCGPDGLDGPCCAAVAATLPAFPTLTSPALGASLLNCGVDCLWSTTATVTSAPVACDYDLFWISFASAAPTDPTLPPSVFFGKYARTWTEAGPTGLLQVWRFLVNGSVSYAPPPPGTPPPTACKVPFSALPPFALPVHYQGHLDYARNCATGAWSFALALTHLCPFEAHAPFSATPIALPPGVLPRTYHFVAPDNFTFGPGPSPEGTAVGDAQRSSILGPTGYTCLAENPIASGTAATPYCDCPCSTAAGPPTYHHQTLTATVANCGVTETIAAVPIPGVLPTGLRVHMFGSWSGGPAAPAYPGSKHVGHYMGVLSQIDLCAGVAAPLGPLHLVTGVGTTGGNPMTIAPTLPATTVAIDLSNMLLFPTLTPGMGGLFVSDRVWSLQLVGP